MANIQEQYYTANELSSIYGAHAIFKIKHSSIDQQQQLQQQQEQHQQQREQERQQHQQQQQLLVDQQQLLKKHIDDQQKKIDKQQQQIEQQKQQLQQQIAQLQELQEQQQQQQQPINQSFPPPRTFTNRNFNGFTFRQRNPDEGRPTNPISVEDEAVNNPIIID